MNPPAPPPSWAQPFGPPILSEAPTPLAMSDPANTRPFRGDSWEECSIFIQGVRTAAWKEGKIQDQAWMAGFASIHFSAKALAWYSRLSRDIQEDWSKLQEALVAQWFPSSDHAGLQNVPAAPAAWSPRGKEKMKWSDYGILKATMEGTDTTYYVWRNGGDGDFSLTEDSAQAVRIRFDSGSSSKLLEYVVGLWAWFYMGAH
ncbi:hypothetical protein M407DRAFT_30774 [Tulasnella calospora MUT 4182]|uniref:Retrotransposon gag domain-containing protein n=1 Tax=Tulasnella calospora MUT 4182 TaxID=1051891 RepID=A0A0C3LDP0_9AGAM|nr:hypothetical protein M407DRAFT_30774 [Tulasnella calospora MUT 4182]